MISLSIALDLLLPLAGGAAIGVVYFGGLWATARRLARAHRPAGLLLGSFLLRMAFFVSGFFLFTSGPVAGIAAYMLGFILSRSLMIRRMRCHETAAVRS